MPQKIQRLNKHFVCVCGVVKHGRHALWRHKLNCKYHNTANNTNDDDVQERAPLTRGRVGDGSRSSDGSMSGAADEDMEEADVSDPNQGGGNDHEEQDGDPLGASGGHGDGGSAGGGHGVHDGGGGGGGGDDAAADGGVVGGGGGSGGGDDDDGDSLSG